MEIGDLVKIAAPIATLTAAAIALFKEDLQACWRAPVLKMRLSLKPPDSHKTFYSGSNEPVFYIRAWVENEGKTRAEDVQIMVANFYAQAPSGDWRPVPGFQAMNLTWSHGGGKSILDRLPPGGMGRHCDFAHIEKDQKTASQGHGPVVAQMYLNLEVTPNAGGHEVLPRFRLIELRLAAGNAAPVSQWFCLDFAGLWYDREEEMFSKGLLESRMRTLRALASMPM